MPTSATAPTPALLRPPEAARQLGICLRTLQDLTRRGQIPAVYPTARAVRYDPADLARFIESRKNREPKRAG